MKKTILSMGILVGAWAAVSCQEQSENPAPQATSANRVASDVTTAAACNVYTLFLNGATGTPAAALDSYLGQTDMCTGNSITVAAIRLSATTGPIIKAVTGLTTIPGSPDLYGTTGRNSNYPSRLLKINSTTGIATIIITTKSVTGGTISLQDIERKGSVFYAIVEASGQVVKVDVATGICTNYANFPNVTLNGLTFDTSNRLWVIAGASKLNCAPNWGDMWGMNMGTGLTQITSYKAANGLWVQRELGLHFDTCCKKNWVVGSASNFLSYNLSLCPTAAIFVNNTIRNTYDFAGSAQ
ncbi:MAG: hypothetical protein U0Y10_08490 [Spirosomataceae bacterium]